MLVFGLFLLYMGFAAVIYCIEVRRAASMCDRCGCLFSKGQFASHECID